MGGEIRAQPFFLGRTGFTTADILAFAIEHDNVPGAEFVAVVTGLGVAGGGSKIIKVRRGSSGTKLVVAGGGASARLYAAPGLVVADEILLAAIRIGEVADSHDGAGDLVKELCRGLGTGKIVAISDIARADENGRWIAGRERARGN